MYVVNFSIFTSKEYWRFAIYFVCQKQERHIIFMLSKLNQHIKDLSPRSSSFTCIVLYFLACEDIWLFENLSIMVNYIRLTMAHAKRPSCNNRGAHYFPNVIDSFRSYNYKNINAFF